jgi:hypothetical protein
MNLFPHQAVSDIVIRGAEKPLKYKYEIIKLTFSLMLNIFTQQYLVISFSIGKGDTTVFSIELSCSNLSPNHHLFPGTLNFLHFMQSRSLATTGICSVRVQHMLPQYRREFLTRFATIPEGYLSLSLSRYINTVLWIKILCGNFV